MRFGLIVSIAGLLIAATPPCASARADGRGLQRAVDRYIDRLTGERLQASAQGVLIQTSDHLMAGYQPSTALPAASTTKAATSLAALVKLGPRYRFATVFGFSATLESGVLHGDLIVKGSGDPFFVWEDAFAVANQLQSLGIRLVEGHLVVVGNFEMNFRADPSAAGALLRTGFDSRIWPKDAATQFDTMPAGTARPALEIRGKIEARTDSPPQVRWIARHDSQPLIELIKRMNLYSNNMMADTVANDVGGPVEVARIAAAQTGIAADELQLISGSGLGIDNRMSPRAICAVLLALDRLLRFHGLALGDAFAIVGRDQGILDKRNLPSMLIAKSGTLATVSDLGGALPTRNGVLWFAIMNQGPNVKRLRLEQARLLADLENIEGSVSQLPPQLAPRLDPDGASARVEMLP
jgi:D-alanyl-D-alanine carboxypeptidase/D-alanyl-D-alanine-endopeptidase (penicillin-binding protein 4)